MAIEVKLSIKCRWLVEKSNDFTCSRCGKEFHSNDMDAYRLWTFGCGYDKIPDGKTNTLICNNCYDDIRLERHGN